MSRNAVAEAVMEVAHLQDRLVQGVHELDRRWPYDDQRLRDAMIELGVSLELYEADLNKEPEATQTAYYSASPREQFCRFLRAVALPSSMGEADSALLGLGLNELELVWMAVHAESLAYFCASPDSRDGSADLQCAIAAALQIEMVFLHADRPPALRQ